ncbi:helix-turn-helix domain-containing protein [Fictibacillus fluitans]|uniref:Helix-turn-helix transcriptional regulator n=1 Tax=Fictibacillus fluitans TaxID=3058422 RepID=A0ABT8HXC3_9BACL|nr:helix-turn-helix transcriptional regulator [Fictibacillus sp. NE201]MDN4525364.1 helix-turn-helix transcriptional regulator [Fictibacillus sp. NE201]
MSYFGDYLRELRIKRGLSMRELSRRSKISHAYISQIENGERGRPSPESVLKLAPHLDVDVTKLMNAAGYTVPHEEFTEEELEFLKELDDGAPLVELIKHRPTIDGKDVTIGELEFAVNVIRSLRQTKKDAE